LPVTMQEMLIHTKAVARGVERAMIVADLPFGSYQKSSADALNNAIKLIKAGAEAIKLEGAQYLDAVKKMVKAGIPVMGHLGFTPQSVLQLGGYRAQGKSASSQKKILKDAKALAQAGCFAIVLEMVPDDLCKKITKALRIPTISCGAGRHCDGQVLVTNDLLGLSLWMPSFAKPKMNLRKTVIKAVRSYIKDVSL
jgi:3-methyl-2-oxobutanoate hydroxymethyltransferase